MKGLAPFAWTALGAGLSAVAIYGLLPSSTSVDAGDRTAEPAVAGGGDDVLRLDAGALARAGVHLATLSASQTSAQLTGFARALDVGALAAIDAEVKAADATAAASRAEAGRLATLASQDQSASQRSVEAARAQAQSDNARAQLAARRVGLEFGPGLGRLGRAGVSALVSDVADGRAALVRIDIAGVTLQSGSTVHIGEGGNVLSVRVLGPAASADMNLQSAGVLAVVRGSGAQGLLAGRVLPATADSGARQSGVIIPRDAIVRYQGALWVYVQKPNNAFERVELTDARAVTDGWFVPSGLAPGTRVAIAGAESLMAIERGSEVSDDDE